MARISVLHLFYKTPSVYPPLCGCIGDIPSSKRGKLEYADGLFAPHSGESGLERLVRPYEGAASDPHRQARGRMLGQFIR
jgi:hypothetical protein